MATEVIKTVKPSGGDYSSLAAWEAGEQRDLVAADEIAVAECYAMSDTTPVEVNGWTTDVTRYVKICTPTAERHGGKWNDTKYMLEGVVLGVGGSVLKLSETALVEGLQVSFTSAGYQFVQGIYSNGGNYADISKCIVKAIVSGGTNACIRNNASIPFNVWNNIVYDNVGFASAGIREHAASGMAQSYNNTAFNCYYGYDGSGVQKNNLAQGCTNGFWGSFSGTSTNNCSDIVSDAPGLNPVTGNVVFVDEGNDDFHLDESDTVAKDAGVDLSADADLPFSDDIDGDTRSAPWDIGADEYASLPISAVQESRIADKALLVFGI